MSQDVYQQPDKKNGAKKSSGRTCMGDLFRDERKKKGLSYADISEITRLRPHILEALENEAWDRLPSLAFAPGFIRSYAKALGLEEDRVVALYKNIAPVSDSLPDPLVEPIKSRKNLFIFLIFLLLTMALAYYLWKEYPMNVKVLTTRVTINPESNKISKPVNSQEFLNKTKSLTSNLKNKSDWLTKKDSQTFGVEMSAGPLKNKERSHSPIESIKAKENEAGPEVEAHGVTLKAIVLEQTWIRVFVDDQNPKDYMFRPGSRPVWKAKEGFELLIGNAGGLGLEFNGEKIENLGYPGQVISLRLPGNRERRNSLN